MGELHVKERDIVVPGEVLATGMDFLPAGGAYRDKELIIASQVGLIAVSGRLVKVVALNWKYLPKKGDTVIGQVVEITQNNWFVDIGYMNDSRFVRIGHQIKIYIGKVKILKRTKIFMHANELRDECIKLNMKVEKM